jgi:hypothetical protein
MNPFTYFYLKDKCREKRATDRQQALEVLRPVMQAFEEKAALMTPLEFYKAFRSDDGHAARDVRDFDGAKLSDDEYGARQAAAMTWRKNFAAKHPDKMQDGRRLFCEERSITGEQLLQAFLQLRLQPSHIPSGYDTPDSISRKLANLLSMAHKKAVENKSVTTENL